MKQNEKITIGQAIIDGVDHFMRGRWHFYLLIFFLIALVFALIHSERLAREYAEKLEILVRIAVR